MKKKIIIITSIVAVLLLIVGGIFAYLNFKPPSPEELSKYDNLIENGDALLEVRDYSEAVNTYNDAIKVIPKDVRAYSKIVDIYILKNDLQNALEIAQKAQNIVSSSDASLIYVKIANQYFDQRDFGNAKTTYEMAASLAENPYVYLGLAKSYVYDSKFDLAKEILQKEYDNQTQDEAHLLYAYLLGLEDRDNAKKYVQDLNISDDNEEKLYFEQYLSALNSLDDDVLYNLTKLSRVYVNNGYPTLAIALLETESEQISQYVDGLYFLGKAYLDSKDYIKATEYLLKSTGLLGYEVNKYWMLGRSYYYQNDLVNSMKYYDMAAGYAGEDISRDLVEEYLSILVDSKQTQKSEEVFSDIVRNVDQEWLYLLGLELFYNANVDAKFDFYLDKLADMSMDDNQKKEYLFWKIRASLDESKTEGVQQDLDVLYELDKFNPKYYWAKGLFDQAVSDNQAAKESFELALEYDIEGKVTEEVKDLLAQIE
jgi:tetratricopeptide (TPR) repeat protein